MNIYAASSSIEATSIFDFSTRYGKQIIWIGAAIVLAIFIVMIDSEIYEKFAAYIYIFTLLLLAGLFVAGKNVNGARAWYAVGSFSLQPTEFAKTGTLLALARLLNDRNFSFKPTSSKLKVLTVILIPMILILAQPDPGSALVYISMLLMLYREGMHPIILIIGTLLITLFLLTLIFGHIHIITAIGILTIIVGWFSYRKRTIAFRFILPKIILIAGLLIGYIYSVFYVFNYVFKQHHRDRFNILLGLDEDTKDVGYNTFQSIKTISSGGFWGKGYLQGDRTKGKFVPEQDTDYIFSTVGEEWGFWGSALLVLIFTLFILRIIYLAEKHKTKFGRVYGYGLASIIFFHFLINIAMVMGLFPTIGIPLPFFSYGGSSLWGFTVLLFVFIKIDASKQYEI